MKTKSLTRRIMSAFLAFVFVLSIVPITRVQALDAGTNSTSPVALQEQDGVDSNGLDAFGIRMVDWTAEERAQALREAPFGSGANMKTPIMTHAELYVSQGQSNKLRWTGSFDWNNANKLSDVTSGVTRFDRDDMTSASKSYKFVDTASIDINNEGKDNYIANLGWNKTSEAVELWIMDAKTSQYYKNPVVLASGPDVSQLNSVDTFQIRGTLAIAAGDFDGDGKDTMIAYVPTVGEDARPFINEYNSSLGKVRAVTDNLFVQLGIEGMMIDLDDHQVVNQPMVSLVAEDVDKDGYDELIVTAGMNDVDSDNHKSKENGRLGSQVFVYEFINGQWSISYHTELNEFDDGDAAGLKRILWASSTVGNMIASTDTGVDYPEILSAGFIEGKPDHFWNIDISSDAPIGTVVIQIDQTDPVKSEHNGNVICNYEIAFRHRHYGNGFTKGGFYKSDDVWSLLAVEAFADRGFGAAESVFISGSVFTVSEEGLISAYTPSYFKSSDDGASSHLLSVTIVQDVIAGNFDGNDYGAEQLICVTSLRRSGKNNSYSDMYVIYNEADLSVADSEAKWQNKHSSSYIVEDVGNYYITLNAVDIDDDSTIVTLKDINRMYSDPNVLAILESTPYFGEIGDGDTGNGQTLYGTSKSSGSGSSNTFGFTAGVVVGYEVEDVMGWEVSVDNHFNWTMADTSEREWAISYANDTGENLVVVYRSPVVSYLYVDQFGNEIIISKTGQPATSMISVEAYNEAAENYGLDKITDSVVALGTPGNPQSYRSTTSALKNPILGKSVQASEDGWIQYSGLGTVEQALSESQEHERTFSYELDISFSIWGCVFGSGKVGANLGYNYERTKTSLNGTGVVKSGSVTGQQEEGYDFQWKFVTWQVELNHNIIPVLGYLVADVVAPPSPAQNPTVETVTKDSITLSWETGPRPAQQYRVYRVMDDTANPYVLVGAVDGDETSCTLTGLESGTQYEYVVRGVGYDQEGNIKLSADSSRVQARTNSANAEEVLIYLSGVDADGVLRSGGAMAAISAIVYKTGGSSATAYKWQMRTADDGTWKDLTNGSGNDGIGSVSGASSKNLKLGSIDKSLDGGALRCFVTVVSTSGTPEYYYSKAVPIDLSGDKTNTTLTVTGGDSGSGTLNDPYNGYMGYEYSMSSPTIDVIEVPVTINKDGVEYQVYSYTCADQTKVYVCLIPDGEDVVYYEVVVDGAQYTLGEPLTFGETEYYFDEDGTPQLFTDVPEGFDGITQETVTVNGETYIRMYAFENSVPVAEYWLKTSNEQPDDESNDESSDESGEQSTKQYYKKVGDGFALVELPSTEDLRGVYLCTVENIIIVDAQMQSESDEDTTGAYYDQYFPYEIYTFSDAGYTLFKTVWEVSDENLYKEGTFYADPFLLTEEMRDELVYGSDYTRVVVPGTMLKLSASVVIENSTTLVDTTVEYIITNVSTGGREILTAKAGESITWDAMDEDGLYMIQAIARKTGSTLSSSDSCYYYARISDGQEYEYRLLVQQNGEQILETGYNLDPITLSLQRRECTAADEVPGDWEDVSGATYYVNNNPLTSNTYTLEAGGAYSFSAKMDNINATAYLEVKKVAIRAEPVWDGIDNLAMNVVPATLEDFEIDVTGAIGNDMALLKEALTFACDLYDADGSILNQTGAFGITFIWSTDENGELTDAAKTIQSRYELTFSTNTVFNLSGSILVSFDSSTNGSLVAEYTDTSGSDYPIISNIGTSIPSDYGVVFIATPNRGFAVSKWTVNGNDITEGITVFDNGMQVLTLDLSNYVGSNGINVEAVFAGTFNPIHFGVNGENGTISAKDNNGNDLASGDEVVHGSGVTFTAVPKEGYMVQSWIVNDEIYTYAGTGEAYRGKTLTLDNISDAYRVNVTFSVNSALEESIAITQANLETAKKELETAIANKADATTVDAAITKLQDAITALENAKDNYTSADENLKAALETAIDAAKNDAITAAKETLANAKEELETAIANKADAAIVNTAIADLQTAVGALEALKDNYETADETLKSELEDKIADANELITSLDNRVAEAETAIEDLEKAVEALKGTDTADAQALAQAIETLNNAIDAAKSAAITGDGTLDTKIEEAKTTLDTKIADVQTNLDDAKAALNKAIANGDTELDGKITDLNDALAAAKAALEATDAADKSELMTKIEAADATLDAAIKVVQKNLDDAKAALNKAIADGDTELDGKITDLNDALAAAKAALEATDASTKTELTTKIDEAYAALEAAITQVQANLDQAKAEFADEIVRLKEEIVNTKDEAQIVPSAIAGVAVTGNVALLGWLLALKRRRLF